MRLICSRGCFVFVTFIAVIMLVHPSYVFSKDYHVKAGDNLQSVIDQAGDGDRILVGEGRHYVKGDDTTGTGLLINGKKSLTLEGKGKPVIIAKTGWVKILTIMSSENITVRGLHLVHDVERGYCFGSVLEVLKSRDVQITGSVLNGSGTQALVVKNADGVTVTESSATRNTEGVFDIANSNNVRIEKVEIVGNDNSGNFSKGILDIADSSNVFFTNNSVTENQNAYFKKVTGSRNVTIKDNSFKNNTFQVAEDRPKKGSVRNSANASSFHTTLKWDDCRTTKSSEWEPDEPGNYFAQECPGFGGYQVFHNGDDGRSWLTIKNDRLTLDLLSAVTKHASGSFPAVSGDSLEWRYRKRGPLYALIFKVDSQDRSDADKTVSQWFVLRVKKEKICVLGAYSTRDEAVAKADSGLKCPG